MTFLNQPLSAQVSSVSFSPIAELPEKRVLNVGSGPVHAGKIHQGFRNEAWREIRLDIDPRTEPDLVGSIVRMRGLVADGSFDAIWCSHCLEHLDAHEVLPSLQECRRILKADGFALITSPDMIAVAQLVLSIGLDAVAYTSPSGPITPLDMIFGHGASIEAGAGFMAHKTGLTIDRLGRLATEAGFQEARVVSGPALDLWAILMMPQADSRTILESFRGSNIEQMFS